MRIIAHLFFGPNTDMDAFLKLRAEEAAHVWRFYKDGVLRDAALRTDLNGAVLTFEVADEAAARELVETLPAVKAGLFHYDLIPVGAFLSYETLFAQPAA